MINIIADVNEYKELSQGIYLCAIGGIPFERKDKKYFYLNNKITKEFLRNTLIKSLGLSGYLTYENKSKLTIEDLGELCLKLEHNWAFKWFTVSFLFIDYPSDVELSFLRDCNFYESWSVKSKTSQFIMNGSLSSFIKYCKNRNDNTFEHNTRLAMNIISGIINEIFYEL